MVALRKFAPVNRRGMGILMDNRRQEIVNLVNREGYVTLSQLRDAFPNISDVTFRKDLSYLDSTLQLIRVHGGAKSLPAASGMIDNFYTRINKNIEDKKIIAGKAVTLLCPNTSIYMASGTTCNEFAKVLPDMKMQIFTDGLATALELAKYTNVETTVFGGDLDPSTLRVQGAAMLHELSNLRFDYAFFSADGYLPELGFVCCTSYFASLLQAVRRHADKLVIMMDSSKINAVRSARLFPLSEVDIVISDGHYDAATLKSFQQAEITVL